MLRLAALLLFILLGGCATITRGTSQTIAIHTPGAPGARCMLSSSSMPSQTVITPATITVEKGMDNIAVRCSKECFQDGTGVVVSSMEAMTAGNLLVGGIIGLGVDAASGAMNKYSPETGIFMAPIQGCRASA
jgi:hypothetical protein